MTCSRLLLACVLLAAHVASAEPAAPPADPAAVVHALMLEGAKQRAARAYDQALANFLEAYARQPSPAILLDVASLLRDMGRLADAANTYQRYLSDPASGAERTAEVKDLLQRLDEALTVLTVRVMPRGSEVSLDGGPFVAVGGALVTRVRPGIHLVRVRGPIAATPGDFTELTVNGFEGETKEIMPTLLAPTPVPPAPPGELQHAAPERVEAWLVTGTLYTSRDPDGPARSVIGDDGRPVAAIVPHDEPAERDHAEPVAHADEQAIASGALAVLRIDGKGRGFAGGLGIAIARGRLETEVIVLKSDQIGGYVGLRYRVLTGVLRPYAAAGVPGFVYDHDELQPDMSTQTSSRLAVGLRVAGGLEVMINPHLSVQADLGYEHFFLIDERYEADVFVPTLGVIGRL